MSYLMRFARRRELRPQVPNSAGGFAWADRRLGAPAPLPDPRLGGWLLLRGRADPDARERDRRVALRRERRPARDREIVAISRDGRAAKNDPAIFALAMAASATEDATRQAALAALPVVCRTGTHLFAFARYVEGFRGWGRSLRRGIATWYLDQPPEQLAYQAVKYRQRDGMTHRDLLRLAHPVADDRRSTRSCSSGSSAAPRRTACRASSRASPPPSARRTRARRRSSSARTTCRARRSCRTTSTARRCGRRCSSRCR